MSHGKVTALVVGARPNFIKAAPLYRALLADARFAPLLIHTGQHSDLNMSQVFFDQLAIPRPTLRLEIPREPFGTWLGSTYAALEREFRERGVKRVLVVGDVYSTLLAASAATRIGIPVVHVEAGLRSHDRRMPEELNRIVADHLAELCLTTEPAARANLLAEGVEATRIREVGNLMIETLERLWPVIEARGYPAELGLAPGRYAVATLHRQENFEDPASARRLVEWVGEIARELPVVLPLHPGTRARLERMGLLERLARCQLVEPLGYVEFLSLVSQAQGVLTDSGGIQEETSHLGIPCVTLRDSTERPITLELGTNRLMPPSQLDAHAALEHLAHGRKERGRIPLWDASVSRRVLEALG